LHLLKEVTRLGIEPTPYWTYTRRSNH